MTISNASCSNIGDKAEYAKKAASANAVEPNVEGRVSELLARMTLDEKIDLLSGDNHFNLMDANGIARLGIPAITTVDGPHGVRWGTATAFPTSVTLGATWNKELCNRFGQALADETLAKGRNMILGPCVNLHRQPFGGRNFESFSEDPYLTSELAVEYIKGVQSRPCIATPKHFAVNNQEKDRLTISANVDDRTLYELYLPAFKASVQRGGAWSIMAAYNKVQGTYACQNEKLLTDILRNQWGFKGLVVSDWWAMKSTVPSIKAGCNLEMPFATHYKPELLKEALKSGEISEDLINERVRDILRVLFVSGIYDDARTKATTKDIDSAAHRTIALNIAREGIVLLKNNKNILPLDRKKVRSIAVIGPNADEVRLGGFGSSMVTSSYAITPLEGILKAVSPGTTVRFEAGCDLLDLPGVFDCIPMSCLRPADGIPGDHGLKAQYFGNKKFEGNPVRTCVDGQVDFCWNFSQPVTGVRSEDLGARWTGKLVAPADGEYKIAAISVGGSRLYLDGKLMAENKGGDGIRRADFKSVHLDAGKEYDVRFEYEGEWGGAMCRLAWVRPGTDSFAEAVKAAAESEVAIVCAGISDSYEGESRDRTTLRLPSQQDALIKAVKKVNPNTIVVLINGSPILMDQWIDSIDGIIEAWYPGQEGGTAIAEVLFGDVNPSGKMPTSFPKRWEDHSAYGNYPGKDGEVNYAEGIFMGYRYYDAKNIEPLFAFGHGLSYTTFEYSDLKAVVGADGKVDVRVAVKNTGSRYGKEVVQIYVGDVNASVPRPPKELKEFAKVELEPGQSKIVTFNLGSDAFSFYNVEKRQWTIEPGIFIISAGSSSRDIRLTQQIEL